MTLQDIITIGLAAIGAILGIMNTWSAMNQQKVRLRVRPSWAIVPGAGRRLFIIEVINQSSFAVTVRDVGFVKHRRGIFHGERLSIIGVAPLDRGPWPRRLESREAVSLFFDPAELFDRKMEIGRAYAKTSCEAVGYGDSPALSQLRREVASM